jgi:hypothetical protein
MTPSTGMPVAPGGATNAFFSPPASAVEELESALTNPPPSLLDVRVLGANGSSSNPVAVAHAVLEAIREAGDESLLFLRAVVELVGRANA